MRNFILGVIVTLLVIVGAVYFYFATGSAPVATSAQAMPFEKTLARMSLEKRMEKEAPKNAPFQATPDMYMDAAHEYVEHCAMCHGLPGKPMPDMAQSMFPHPPALWEGKGVTDDPPGETWWVIENGIRLTGMPSFKNHMDEKEKWQMALFLHDANKLPANVTDYLKSQQMTAHGMGAGESHEHHEHGGEAEEDEHHDHDHDHPATKQPPAQPHKH
jgi:thiosulfate dehydrogenase